MPNTTPEPKKPFPFDKARESILTISQIQEVKFIKTGDGQLDGIRASSDGSLPDKEVAARIAAVLLLDLDYHVDHRIIRVIPRSEMPPVRRRRQAESR